MIVYFLLNIFRIATKDVLRMRFFQVLGFRIYFPALNNKDGIFSISFSLSQRSECGYFRRESSHIPGPTPQTVLDPEAI